MMIVNATYFQNDEKQPIVYGPIEILNQKRVKLRGEIAKEGILAESVFVGFCGTDKVLMEMGQNKKLSSKFPVGCNRLINGHEGIVWIPDRNKYGVVLIRGGESFDPTRFEDDENYFEYGCDGADGLFSDCNYYHPDMLIEIPDNYINNGRLPLSLAKRIVFADPYACMLFQIERMEDLGSAHNFRVEIARNGCSEEVARELAKRRLFDRTVVFGLGTTGIFIADLIRQRYPEANIVFVARSESNTPKVQFAVKKTGAKYTQNNYEEIPELVEDIQTKLGGKATLFIGTSGSNIESKVAFEFDLLGNNGIYNSFSLGPQVVFNSMPFGFKNQLIFSSINFRLEHMKKAIKILANSDYDKIVKLISKKDFIKDPLDAYLNKIYTRASPLKTAIVWNEKFIDMDC